VVGSDRGKLCGIGILDFQAECQTGHVVSGSAQVFVQMRRYVKWHHRTQEHDGEESSSKGTRYKKA